VQEVAVAGFDVDEAVADMRGEPRRFYVIVDELFELGVGPDDGFVVRVDTELFIEQGVVVGDAWFGAGLFVWLAEAAGVGELLADQQPVE
jgi:hypothetical protein